MEGNQNKMVPVKRPQFITVLCILSFVGIGLHFIFGISNYFSYSAMASTGDFMQEMAGEEIGAAMSAVADAFDMDYGKMATGALAGALLNIPLLFGVLLMWKLRKTGFYIYAAAELVQAIVPVIIVGGFVASVTTIAMLVIGIAFIILYGVNLKYMS